jgi:DNA uptake protein ComE-like DNA-binding protein
MDELRMLPGVGRSTAGDIVVDRPYGSLSEVDLDTDLSKFATLGPVGAAD